jgi:hypothetical protein
MSGASGASESETSSGAIEQLAMLVMKRIAKRTFLIVVLLRIIIGST